VVPDRFNELRLRFNGYDLAFRACDEGVSYRCVLAMPDTITIVSEKASFAVAGQAEGVLGIDTTFMTHYEPTFHQAPLDTLEDGRRALLPTLVAVQGGPKIAITESQLEDYPGLYLVAGPSGGSALVGLLPQAALELMDYHGAHKPAGLDRTWPNVLGFEGVHGLEHNKWATDVTPDHNVTLPFTRMLAGPMDDTPGAMRNVESRDFRIVSNHPQAQGTRAHQLAMYVVYEAPLQMLGDSPTAYEREPDALDFLRAVPTVWDDTRSLDGRVGEYVVGARRRDDRWFIGAMTNNTARTLSVNLSFLGDGTYSVDATAGGINADRNAMDYRRERSTVTRSTTLTLQLAPGGGYVAMLTPAH
jgi:hypothetical protein